MDGLQCVLGWIARESCSNRIIYSQSQRCSTIHWSFELSGRSTAELISMKEKKRRPLLTM